MGTTDSKLAFRKGVFRLFEERFWTLPETADDIFSLIAASDVRRVRDHARENLETLIDKTMEHMEATVNAHNFPCAQHSINHLLNCCRVLTRLMPYIFESSEHTEWEDAFFWTPRSVEKLNVTREEAGQQVNNKEITEKASDTEKASVDVKSQPHYDSLPPRGQVLIACKYIQRIDTVWIIVTIKCLFLTGFTLPISMATKESRIVYAIWEAGVGSSTEMGVYKDNEVHRTEVLRLLTVLLSKSMYIPSSQLLSKEDLWLRYVAVETERKTCLVMLCSLINTACKYDPTGWGVPYNHMVLANPREKLVTMCLRVLLILFDYRSPRIAHQMRQVDQENLSALPTDITAGVEVLSLSNALEGSFTDTSTRAGPPTVSTSDTQTSGQRSANEADDNVFRYYLSRLHRSQDFEFLMSGMYRILLNPLQASNTYLPGSTKRVQCNIEMMMVCWRVMEINARFRAYLMETDHALDLMVVLIYYTMENKANVAQVGLVRMCTFILQTLSSDRAFGVKLSKPFVTQSYLPALIRIPASHGTYGDFLIISIFSLIATTHGTLSTLYPALVLTISNVSPYLKHLSVTCSSKLLGLLSSISAPGFLLADEANYKLLGYLLEAFNNIIQYQFTDNPNFVYAIVRNHTKFERLKEMTFQSAVAEVERKRQLIESRAPVSSFVSSPVAENAKEDISLSSPIKEERKDKEKEKQASSITAEEAVITPTTSTTSTTPTTSTIEEETAAPSNPLASTSAEPEAYSSVPTKSPRRQGSISSTTSSTASLFPGAKHGFVPTEEWFYRWYSQLSLQTTLLLLEHLVPQVEAKCATEALTTDAQVLEFLRQITLVGILPHPQPIFIRKFQWGEALFIWFRSMLWGQAYVSSIAEYGAWNGTQVKLFQIKQRHLPSQSSLSQHSHDNPPSPRMSLGSVPQPSPTSP
ncbi:high-temperature-induced dauer-formation protein-domain-containing protein [Spinellus fusiger]|nr:high-temperature-induced dauer-formation protein-domain-containing protein [Spinellus fusiger]